MLKNLYVRAALVTGGAVALLVASGAPRTFR